MNNACLTLEFDDSFKETVKTVLPILNRFGFKACFSVIGGLIESKFDDFELLTKKQLEEIIKGGQEVASHGFSHVSLAYKKRVNLQNIRNLLYVRKMSYLKKLIRIPKAKHSKRKIDLMKEVLESKRILTKFYPVSSLTYPGGAYNEEIINLLNGIYGSARTVDRGFNSSDADRYKLKAMLWDKHTSVKEANKWVDKAIKEKKWLIEVFHLVSDSKQNQDYEYFTSKKNFVEHLDYVKGRVDSGKIVVKTRDKIICELFNHKKS